MPVQLLRGILVAFEGIDGAGKTTQARLLEESLRSKGLAVLRRKEPTDGYWGEVIREHLRQGRRLSPEQELEAFEEDRRIHVREAIAPALARNEAVILDRYFLSSAAYQGARGLDPVSILTRNEGFAPLPDVAFILEITVEEALRRIAIRGNGTNLFERGESLAAVAQAFGKLERPYVKRIDGTRPEDEIAREVYATLLAGPLFQTTCLKTNLSTCEPAYCTHRMEGSCSYGFLAAPDCMVGQQILARVSEIAGDAGLDADEKLRRIQDIMLAAAGPGSFCAPS